VEASILSAWAWRRKATEQMAVLALTGSLNECVAQRRIFKSLMLVLSLLLSSHHLPSSQDQASFAEETGLGEAVTCTLRLARGKKPWEF
jgi:hypothetical protein